MEEEIPPILHTKKSWEKYLKIVQYHLAPIANRGGCVPLAADPHGLFQEITNEAKTHLAN